MTNPVPHGLLIRPPWSIHIGSVHFDPTALIHHFHPHGSVIIEKASSLVAPSPHGSVIKKWKDLWGDSSITRFWGTTSALTGWPKIINDKGHMSLIEWSLTQIKASLYLLCHSLYISQTLPLSFLYFLLKSTIKAHPSSLSDHSVQLFHLSSTPFFRPTSTW